MKSDGSVRINTEIDTQGFGKGVNTMQKQVGGLTSAIGKLGLAIAATFAIGKLIRFGKEAIELGSDLQEVQNVVDVTFTSISDKVDEFAKNAAKAAGLSETMAKRYVGTFGAMAKAFGFGEGEAYDMSTALTQLTGDVASFYNLTQDEAYTKLKSIFTGETESLKDLGVVMTQTALDSFAMAKGYGKTTKAMSEAEKVYLRFAFVTEQLNAASGDFIRTQDSWANQTRILSLNFDTFKANIGKALINIFTPFLKFLNVVVEKLAQLSKYLVVFSELLVGKSTSGGGGSPGKNLENIASGYDDITDSTNEAIKAQKKYTNSLDELNIISKDTESAQGGISGAIGGGISAGDITGDVESIPDRITAKFEEFINYFKTGDWGGLAGFISVGFSDALNGISAAVSDFDWQGLGEDIGEFMAGLDWKEIIGSTGNFIETLLESAIDLWKGSFDASPIGTTIISALLLGGFKPKGVKNLASGLLSKILLGFKTGGAAIAGGITSPAFIVIASSILDSISEQIKALVPNWLYDLFDNILSGAVIGAVAGSWFPALGQAAGAIVGAFTGALKTKFDGKSILDIWAEKLFNFDFAFSWFDAAVESFRTAFDGKRQDWFDIGSYIVEGIIEGIIGALAFIVEPIMDLFDWTWEVICDVFGIHSPAESMKPIGEYILLGIVEGFRSMFGEFSTAMSEFWDKKVKPWFTARKWKDLLFNIKDAFSDAFTGAVNVAIGLINGLLSALEFMINETVSALVNMANLVNVIPGMNIAFEAPNVSIPKIPYLATGAVIPPNAPFMAMLGDQRHGTNLEAPEDLIRQIVREEAGGSREIMELLTQIARNTRDAADKELSIGDRAIARANARGQRSMGYKLITEG